MNFHLIESNPTSLTIELSGVSPTFVNSLRRIILNDVKAIAIDSVTFYENSASMFDEYVAHRIGLIPISMPKKYDEKEEILFSLEAEGPKTVYSKDLKSTDKEVKVANENIPIIKLAEGQKLKVTGKAVLGLPSKSTKFQAGLASYKAKSDDTFEFYIESFGQMPPTEILSRALNIISDGIKELQKEMKK